MHLRRSAGIIILFIVAALYGCGGGGSAATGAASVGLTDAPGDFDSVFVTVKDIWFHASDAAGPGDAGWFKYPLAAPVSVNLLSLSNGVVGSPVWGNISLPAGTYQQIRLVLAGTEDALTGSASAAALLYNNEVQISGQHYPLRVPDAKHGIRLPGTFRITGAGTLRLAVDFDADHDIVDIQRNGKTEYILKPRLAYFDLDDAGAIVGRIDPASAATTTTSAHFVVKAEQVNDPSNPEYHVVRRFTRVDPATGRYVLYPLRPGTYDIVIRGIDYQTIIIKGVPVTRGTTPVAAPTVVPQITMVQSSVPDYSVDGAIPFPTGAWVNFYQTLQDGSVPYEVRFRHFNPITGRFTGFKLSSDPLRVASYVSGTLTSAPTVTTPLEQTGGFSAAAGAELYSRSAYTWDSGVISQATTTALFGALTPASPAVGNSISGTISMGPMTSLNQGILFAVHGGMIVNTIDVGSQMSGGGQYVMTNLPGGTPSSPLPGAVYGVEALGWSTMNSTKAVAVPGVADLRTGNAGGVDMNMIAF